jgi:hypothetical protein
MGHLVVHDLGRHMQDMQFNVCSCIVFAKHCLGHVNLTMSAHCCET